ncbi:hypothetical protein QOZ80_6AG0506450 [Eleusine coracana subsp. coracana]|nr:hypothetical protein QOZ80_6AG0506450 [Eleusine coracana subsp. coracana]
MAMRALAAAIAGRRVAVQSGFPALASTRRGGSTAHESSSSRRCAHTQAEEREGVTAAQVEAALNSKNVEEEEEVVVHAATTTVLPEEVVHHDADAAAWVPDQDTGVFVPADEAAAGSSGATHEAHNGASSVLDQTVFNREEEMEDLERPAVDMANK